jgi:hypothetical protein
VAPVNAVRAAAEWLLGVEGSTRSVALMRIGLVLVAWSRFGRELLLHQSLDDGRWLLALFFFLTSVPALIGYKSRASTFAFGACVLGAYGYLTWLTGFFERAPLIGQHTYLMGVSICLLALTPCGHSLSLDRWLALERGDAPPEHGPLWGLRLIGLQVSIMYFWAAYEKTSWVFLSGARLEHIVTYFYTFVRPDFPGAHTLFAVVSSMVVAFEYALVVGLWSPRWRWWFIGAGLVFHAVIYVTLSVLTFSALMFVLYLAFVPPAAIHRALDRLVAPVG